MKSESKFKSIMFCIWVIVAFLIIQLVVSIGCAIPVGVMSMLEAGGDMNKYMEIYMGKITGSGLLTMISTASVVLSLIVGSIWYYNGYYKKKKAAGRTGKLLPKIKDKYFIGFFLVAVVGTYSFAGILQGVAGTLMPEINSTFNDVMSMTMGGNAILSWIMAVILAPINEEIAVRGIIIERSRRNFGLIGCIVISAIMFSVYHMNPIQGLYVLPMGVFWGYLAYKTESVIPSIIGHMLNNLLGTLVGNSIVFDKCWWILLLVCAVTFALAFFFGKKTAVFAKTNSEEGNDAIDEVKTFSCEESAKDGEEE